MALAHIIVLMALRERVLRHLQHNRNQDEQLLHDIFRNLALESLDLLAVLFDDVRTITVQLGQVLEHIQHLDIIRFARQDLAAALGSVAVVVTVHQVGLVLHLLLDGQGEEVLADGELPVDLVLGEAEVGDVEEADIVDGVLELVGEGLFAVGLVEFGEVEGDEVGPFDCEVVSVGCGWGWEVMSYDLPSFLSLARILGVAGMGSSAHPVIAGQLLSP